MKRFVATVVAMTALSLSLAACGGGGSSSAAGSSDSSDSSDLPPDYVLVKNSKYTPKTLRVAVGTEVTFDFDDGSLAHNAVAKDKSFDTGLHTDKTVSVTIDKPGEHDYICTLHPAMKGTIIAE